MTKPTRTKSEYGVMPLWVRADRKYVNRLKANASLADMPLADYIRTKLDVAISNESGSFVAESGNDCNQIGKDKQ